MDIIVIMRNEPNSWTGSSTFVAAAKDTESAKRWIQDEVDGKHSSGNLYAPGKSADWWIASGYFSLKTDRLH